MIQEDPRNLAPPSGERAKALEAQSQTNLTGVLRRLYEALSVWRQPKKGES